MNDRSHRDELFVRLVGIPAIVCGVAMVTLFLSLAVIQLTRCPSRLTAIAFGFVAILIAAHGRIKRGLILNKSTMRWSEVVGLLAGVILLLVMINQESFDFCR